MSRSVARAACSMAQRSSRAASGSVQCSAAHPSTHRWFLQSRKGSHQTRSQQSADAIGARGRMHRGVRHSATRPNASASCTRKLQALLAWVLPRGGVLTHPRPAPQHLQARLFRVVQFGEQRRGHDPSKGLQAQRGRAHARQRVGPCSPGHRGLLRPLGCSSGAAAGRRRPTCSSTCTLPVPCLVLHTL